MVLFGNAEACEKDFRTASTIQFYRENAERYAERHNGVSPNLVALRNQFVSALPAGAKVIDLGAGPGRDAVYFEEQGFEVIAIEPAEELARIAESRINGQVLRILAQELSYNAEIDGIWAMASLIHVPPEELPGVFRRMARALKPGGEVHMSFTVGVGHPDQPEIEPKGRYFNRVTEAKLREIISEIRELEIIEPYTETARDDYHGDTAPTSEFGFLNMRLRRNEN